MTTITQATNVGSRIFTDSEIGAHSIKNSFTKEQNEALQIWCPDDEIEKDEQLDNLENSKNEPWDQFANKKTTYHENLYTTEIDPEFYRRKEAKAGRIARDINSSSYDNIHIAEERNLIAAADYDEEELYSSVVKQQLQPKSNKKNSFRSKRKSNKTIGDNTQSPSPPVSSPIDNTKLTHQSDVYKNINIKGSIPLHQPPPPSDPPPPPSDDLTSKTKLKLNPQAKIFESVSLLSPGQTSQILPPLINQPNSSPININTTPKLNLKKLNPSAKSFNPFNLAHNLDLHYNPKNMHPNGYSPFIQ